MYAVRGSRKEEDPGCCWLEASLIRSRDRQATNSKLCYNQRISQRTAFHRGLSNDFRNVDMSMDLNAGSSQTPTTEKPHHYTYLKEFRTTQCPLFLQHKCTQHRPFTCFHWHFMNQRRRRPVKKRDGTFSYSPDQYCAKYDETTGICTDGDECMYLHRTAGDTERRYHLRYYKTGTCVHETDSKGHCTKNGPHCAFAHGAHDLRPPLYDVRELKSMETIEQPQMPLVGTPGSLEKERVLLDDPSWNDTSFVLAFYKTESCKRPPRLCRQGYACPQFHNSRDRRRTPKRYKYRSTPCPHVKHGDDWSDPGQCETGDDCPYCHTRTEQQFHPEIYKSTRCNDMAQTGYCPRGPFCAFAHSDHEMSGPRDLHMGTDNSLAAFVSNVLSNVPEIPGTQMPESGRVTVLSASWGEDGIHHKGARNYAQQAAVLPHQTHSHSHHRHLLGLSVEEETLGVRAPLSQHKPRLSSSTPSSITGFTFGQRAPGSGRGEDPRRGRHHSQTEADGRQHALWFGLGELTSSSESPLPAGATPPKNTALISPQLSYYYPTGDTLESVIGTTLEDLSMEDFDLSSIDKELEKDDTNSLGSSFGQGLGPRSYLGAATSVPVNIPNHRDNHCTRNSVGSLSQSPSSPLVASDPAGQLFDGSGLLHNSHSTEGKLDNPLEQVPSAFNRQPLSTSSSSYLGSSTPSQLGGSLVEEPATHSMASLTSQSPLAVGSPVTLSTMSPRTSASSTSPTLASEVQRLREALASNKAKLNSWEEGISQARNACEAWRKEAEDANNKARLMGTERGELVRQRDELLDQLKTLKAKLESTCPCSWLHTLPGSSSSVEALSLLDPSKLSKARDQLTNDLKMVEQVMDTPLKCLTCQKRPRTRVALPCEHFVLCESCVGKGKTCPFCQGHIMCTRRENQSKLDDSGN